MTTDVRYDESPTTLQEDEKGTRTHACPSRVPGQVLTLAKAIRSATEELRAPDVNIEQVRDALYTALVSVGLTNVDLDQVTEGVDPSIGYYCFVGDEMVTFLPQFSAVDDYLFLPSRRRADAALLEVIATFHQSASSPFPEGTTDSNLMEVLDVHGFEGDSRAILLEKARRLGTLGVTSDILNEVDEAHIARTFTV